MASNQFAPDFEAFFNSTPTPILVIEPPEWIIVAANDARVEVTGKTREETIGRKLFDVFPDDPDDPSADGVRKLSESLGRVLASRAQDVMEVQRYAVSDDHGRFVQRWWSPVNTPVLDEDGEVSFVLHQVEEVSDLARMQLLLESLPGAAYRCQMEAPWRMLYISEGLRFISSYSPDDFTSGRINWGDMVHPDDREQLERDLSEALASRNPFSFHYRILDPVRGTRWISEAGRGIYMPDGGIESLVGFLVDVTEHEDVQERLREAQAALIHLSQHSAMNAMAATIAHELNQPLLAAVNYLSGTRRLVAKRMGGDESIEAGLNEAEQQILRAGEIIRRMRSLVAQAAPRYDCVSLGELLPRVEKILVSGETCPGMRLRYDIPPQADQVRGDQIQIEQVFLNLIRNSCEAMSSLPERNIEISADLSGGSVHIRLRDFGPGIAEENRDGLFTAYRESSTGGLGVGLSISRTIIEAHGGRISAGHAAGGGAVFHIILPAFSGETAAE